MRRRDGRCGWFVAVWLCAGPGLTAWALSISPPVVELRVSAGARAEGSFLVRNDTQQPLVLTVETEALSSQGYLQRPCADWLQVAPDRLVLEPGQQDEVRYVVSVSAGAQGELAAEVVFVQAFSSPETGGVQVRFGAALYASIEGTERLSVRAVNVGLHTDREAADVRFRLENTGNVHCRPEGELTVDDGAGRVVARGVLPRSAPAHPAHTDVFIAPLAGVRLAPGPYHVTADLTCAAAADVSATVHVDARGTMDDAGQWHEISTNPPSPR